MLLGCDGERSLGEVLAEAAVPDGLERHDFNRLCLDTIRQLITRGFLVDAS
ncbi:MAG: hypothetical protein ACR2LK_04225 [Solirubrobacteraceae bacterium]